MDFRGIVAILALGGCTPFHAIRDDQPIKYDAMAAGRCAETIEEAVIDAGLPVAEAKRLIGQVYDDLEAGKIPRCGLPPGNSTGR